MPDAHNANDNLLDSVCCPACDTRFRCQFSDLAIADGLLRCGVCQHVFNATEQLTPAQREAFDALVASTANTTPAQDSPEPDSNDSDETGAAGSDKKLGPELLEGLSTNDHGFEFHQSRARRRWPWLLVNSLALIALLAQWAYWQRSDLLSHPNLPPEIKAFALSQCAQLSLTCLPNQAPPGPQPSSDIISQKLLVRPHPDVADALKVDAILLNKADGARDFPLLQLRFSNIHGIELASRLFYPSEYLAGELNALSQLDSGQPVHIALEIAAPAADAVNYELRLFSRP